MGFGLGQTFYYLYSMKKRKDSFQKKLQRSKRAAFKSLIENNWVELEYRLNFIDWDWDFEFREDKTLVEIYDTKGDGPIIEIMDEDTFNSRKFEGNPRRSPNLDTIVIENKTLHIYRYHSLEV